MKLEKVVSRPKKGLWIFLFILGLVMAGLMAASYNVEIVQHVDLEGVPWDKVIFGAIGFIAIISSLALFFARLLREMKIRQIQADFLDRISHELRTPLSTLTLVSDLLRTQNNSTEEIEKLWSSHSLELDRLRSDVELLLQAAQLRQTQLHVELKRIDLEAWIQEKWSGFQQLLGDGAKLTRSGPQLSLVSLGPKNGVVEVDPTLLELILRNLMDNARKFAIGRPLVEMRTELINPGVFRKKIWRISIVDQGLGFLPKNQGFLFKRFSRLPQSPELQTTSIQGTGLGLYLSVTASRAMGLKLTGFSRGEGRGAEFQLEGTFQKASLK